MMIEWDEQKRHANLAKHGVDFAEVVKFDMETAVTVEDTRFDYGETRYQSLGYIESILHMLVYTPRGTARRIISLRPASDKEVKAYGKIKGSG
jgi:hypothetical protein